MLALIAGALSIFGESAWWQTAGAVASVIVLGLVVWQIVLGPINRRRRLKHPCKAHFVIREMGHTPLPYVVQDDQMHLVRELVLPAHAYLDIEIGYTPTIHFNEFAFVFACEGDPLQRPFARERFTRFIAVGKNHWVPGTDPSDTIDVHGYYHIKRDVPRNVKSHFVNGFKLQTRGPGIYPVVLTFFTDEIEGTAHLKIRVEERPRTRMRCIQKGHIDCVVRPQTVPAD